MTSIILISSVVAVPRSSLRDVGSVVDVADGAGAGCDNEANNDEVCRSSCESLTVNVVNKFLRGESSRQPASGAAGTWSAVSHRLRSFGLGACKYRTLVLRATKKHDRASRVVPGTIESSGTALTSFT